MPQASPRGTYLEVSDSLRQKIKGARSQKLCRLKRGSWATTVSVAAPSSAP